MSAYARAKFIVETNARGQARFDADDLSVREAIEYTIDPRVLTDAMDVLKESWARAGNTKIVFTQLDEQDYEALSEAQRHDLVMYWCTLYPTLVIEYLKKRLEGKPNGS
jgi:hypothetical protein